MERKPRRPLRLAVLVVALGALAVSILASGAFGGPGNTKLRWDIVSIDFAAGAINPGGTASASANDGSKITVTGRGTFRSNPGKPQNVTGGGAWTTYDAAGNVTGTGTYKVKRFVTFTKAPGTAPPLTDNIGSSEKARAGLVVLGVRYSDGTTGTLVVSCHLVGTPDSVFEGITATKGFVAYWNPEAPVDGVDGNRTLFHAVR